MVPHRTWIVWWPRKQWPFRLFKLRDILPNGVDTLSCQTGCRDSSPLRKRTHSQPHSLGPKSNILKAQNLKLYNCYQASQKVVSLGPMDPNLVSTCRYHTFNFHWFCANSVINILMLVADCKWWCRGSRMWHSSGYFSSTFPSHQVGWDEVFYTHHSP